MLVQQGPAGYIVNIPQTAKVALQLAELPEAALHRGLAHWNHHRLAVGALPIPVLCGQTPTPGTCRVVSPRAR